MRVHRKPDESESSRQRFSLELFIVHPTLSTTDISAELGIEPHFAHEVGAPRRTPKGTRLEGNYRDTRWRYTKRYDVEDQRFAKQLAEFVECFSTHGAFIRKIRVTGGTATIVVAFLGDGYFGDVIALSTLSKLVELQLDLSIVCYDVVQT